MTRCMCSRFASWRGFRRSPSNPARLHPGLHLGHVGVVLVGDLAPVPLGPVGHVPDASTSRRGSPRARPLEHPGVLDRPVGIEPVGTDPEEDRAAGVDRPDDVREAVDVLGARHLVGFEARDVEPAGGEQLEPPGLVRRQQLPAGQAGRAQLVDERALLGEERAAETRDERGEDLAFVVLVLPQPEPRARPELAARAGSRP